MLVCVDSYLLAHTEETLEAWKRKRLFTENFITLLGILNMSMYYLFQKTKTKTKTTFFFNVFNFYHTKRLRISKTFHSRNQHNLAPDCSYILPRFNRPSAINASTKPVPKHWFQTQNRQELPPDRQSQNLMVSKKIVPYKLFCLISK